MDFRLNLALLPLVGERSFRLEMNVQGRMFIYVWIGLKLLKCEG